MCTHINRITIVRPFIQVPDNSPFIFRKLVSSSLDRVEETQVGKRLLRKIEASAKHVVIIQNPQDIRGTPDFHKLLARMSEDSFMHLNLADAPNFTFIRYSGLPTRVISTDFLPIDMPPFLNLAHELIHASHCVDGARAPDLGRANKLVWSNDEEYNTIMGFPSESPSITENAFRAELGLPERFSHHSFELLRKHCVGSLIYQRVKLAAEVYRRTCLELGYKGQNQNPPPIINCSSKDLGFSARCMIHCTLPDGRDRYLTSLSHQDLSEEFVQRIVSVDRCPGVLKSLKDSFPADDFSKIEKLTFHRVSDLEADAPDLQ